MGNYYAGMMNSDYMRELHHHGIKGQKWGIMNGPPYPIKSKGNSSPDKRTVKNVKNARTSNLDKWGKDAEHNTLYITGYSGSGKSTTALGLKKSGDTVIHLDGYTENGDDITSIQDKKFNAFLDKNLPKWKDISKSVSGESSLVPYSKEYWNLVDEFLNTINSYSTKEFENGNRVIVEGVQIADDWFGDSSKLKGKPTIVLGTNALSSMSRAFNRDGRGNLAKGLLGLDDPKDYIKWVKVRNKKLKDISKATDSKKRQKYLNEFIKTL